MAHNEIMFKRGDVVRIKAPGEIRSTLDESGELEGVPFMGEMERFCGGRFTVRCKVGQVCFDGASLCGKESAVREFRGEAVYFLDGVRCDGSAHGGCRRDCSVFWKESWLEAVGSAAAAVESSPGVSKSTADHHGGEAGGNLDERRCQSARMLGATRHISHFRRCRKVCGDVVEGNHGIVEAGWRLLVYGYWKVRQCAFGAYPRGDRIKTPTEVLGLKEGEWVEVKSLAEIRQTLNKDGLNRGLHFLPNMIPFCGKRYRVKARVERFIVEGTGVMRALRNTVTLEGVYDDGVYYVFGGCPRQVPHYWREIWLRRLRAGDESCKQGGLS